MAETLMEGKVCPNHPNIQATKRCTTCFKPLCDDCRLVKGDLDFCSDKCATNHFTTNAHIEDGFAREAARKRRARIRKMIMLIILMLLAFGFAFWWREMATPAQKKGAKNMVDRTSNKIKKEARKMRDE